ncbi:MAG: anhydro-N-acetylmuramic acid kinase [Anaerolineae bacterium]|nr:anhydro-N-acetylmuramic acid kinase [Anaerolineae bacterium]
MRIIGLMSGTSADGIDAALCEIEGQPPQLRVKILAALTLDYQPDQRQRILDACQPATGHVDTLCRLNFDLGEWFAQAVLKLVTQAGLTPADIDLIASHGQTVWHQVESDGHVSATLQIGEASVIAERTGITTLHNFRPRDVTAGGQGAPLTGYADWLLLRHPEHWRAVQNIGGMGNVTFLPPLCDENSLPLAFDTGPGNVLIDIATTVLTDGAQTYDRDGALAAKGQIDEGWLAELMTHSYFERRPPKTTGRELFGSAMAQQLVRVGQTRGLNREAIIVTLTALTASSIADAYRLFAPHPPAEVILGGGGQHNRTLVAYLQNFMPNTKILRHEDIGLSSDFKEALVFAILAYETWHNRPGNMPALTGASHPAILGQITPGRKYATLVQRTWGAP